MRPATRMSRRIDADRQLGFVGDPGDSKFRDVNIHRV